MTWYRAGTVTVTNNSPTIIGAGTDFVSNVDAGDAFRGPDGRTYEIARVVSATELTLGEIYVSGTAGGQSYAIQPTPDRVGDLANATADLVRNFSAVRDGVGRGLFGDGTAAAPGMRFTADQDTGIRRYGNDSLAIVAGGVDRVVVASDRVQVVTAVTVSGNQPVRMEASQGGAGAFGRFEFFNSAGFSSSARAHIEGRRDANADNGYLDLATADDTNLPPTVKATLTPTGNFGVGTRTPQTRGHFAAGDQTFARCRIQNTGMGGQAFDLVAGINSVGQAGFSIFDATNGMTRMTIDANGNLLVGVTSHPFHRVVKQVDPGAAIFTIDNAFASSVFFFGTDRNSFSNALSAMQVGVVSSTGRSINAGGTINASGADYAEYISKSDGCGAIAKGDVCGIDRRGLLTKLWSSAVRFVVKSTDPNLVGGDSWSAHLGSRPNAPIYEAPLYDGPADESDTGYDAARSAYDEVEAVAVAAHNEAMKVHAATLAKWEADLEAARQTVDRIAFCGQVPVNVDTDTLAACEAALADGVAVYLVAIARGAGIGVTAVREGDMTLPQYMRRVGCVWAIRDGRPWVDVQHG